MNPMQVEMDLKLSMCGVNTPTTSEEWKKMAYHALLLQDTLAYGPKGLMGHAWLGDPNYLCDELSRKRKELFSILPDWPGLTDLPNQTLGKIYQTIMQVRSEYRNKRKQIDSDLLRAGLKSSDTTEDLRKLKVEYYHYLHYEELGSSPGERVSISDVDETTIPCPVEEYRPAPLPEDEFDD